MEKAYAVIDFTADWENPDDANITIKLFANRKDAQEYSRKLSRLNKLWYEGTDEYYITYMKEVKIIKDKKDVEKIMASIHKDIKAASEDKDII